tara:strand:+ start:364 stop:816 length:453 start_codon:yes stop_codon:yes gene_type:complete
MAFLFELSAGRQEKVAYDYNADINERNAKASDQEAAQLIFAEEQNIVEFREQFSDLQDAQAQAYRYNGWIAEEGTPLKVALASAQEADEEIAARRYNAKVGSQELKEAGVQERMQGTLNRMYGRAAMTRGRARAFTSLLNTGFRAYSAFG